MFLWHIPRRLLAIVLLNWRATFVLTLLVVGGWLAYAPPNRDRLAVYTNNLVPAAVRPAETTTTPTPAAQVIIQSADVPQAVQDYMRGYVEYDATLIWSALADEAIQAMQSQGGSVETLQQALDTAKQQGARIEDVTLVGNYQLTDGRRYVFYVASRRGFAGTDQLDQVYFVFTVGLDGKILQVL